MILGVCVCEGVLISSGVCMNVFIESNLGS
jgi:hypothetical protein